MKRNKNLYNDKKIHFIGIGGISMSAIAKHVLKNGAIVSGSDLIESNLINELESRGVKVHIGHNVQNLKESDWVVYTKAVCFDNPELRFAKDNGIKLFSRSQILGEIISGYNKSICVSGSHGKTTTTAMIANALIKAHKDPTVFLGGEDKNFGNYRFGQGDVVIAEACEYKKSFLDLKSDICVVLNIDNDHLDCYENQEQMVQAFKAFIKDSIAIINADDKLSEQILTCTTITFGINKKAMYTAKNIKEVGSNYSFEAYAYGTRLGRINLSAFGKHNIYNALAAIAVCDLLKIPFTHVKTALENFNGVKRRNEYIGELLGRKCYCDYAHHPEEIKATLNAYSKSGQDFITVFQPHTYSRTKYLMADFVNVLKDEQPLIIVDTYPAREVFDVEGSAQTLKENIESITKKDVGFVCDMSSLILEIKKKLTREINRIIFLGAGDVYEMAKNILV